MLGEVPLDRVVRPMAFAGPEVEEDDHGRLGYDFGDLLRWLDELAAAPKPGAGAALEIKHRLLQQFGQQFGEAIEELLRIPRRTMR